MHGSGPTAIGDRALGPDLARGLMLLAIALANSHYFLQGSSVLGGFPQDGGTVDRVVTWAIASFVDGRAFPMFGLLFGYGVAHVVARQTGTRWETRVLLWRRSAVLIVLGLLDALLLYAGDILGAYGVLLLLGAWAIGWSDRWVLGVAALFLLITSLPGGLSLSTSPDPPDASMLPPDLGSQLVERALVVPWIALLGPLGFVCPYLLGLWLGRHRVLEQPHRHRTLLRVVAVGGVGAAVLGAQPVALLLARVTETPEGDVLALIGTLHDATGTLGGFGYAALLTLVATRIGPRPGRIVRAVAATGQRSLTCYLAQSLAWWLLFTPYLLDLSDTLDVATTALVATTVWLATVWWAARNRAAGGRGPFERLLRRATYGRPTNSVAP